MDVAIAWNNKEARGDWAFVTGDLLTRSDIESAVLVSLFTDRKASPDFVPTDGTGERRGWWGDTFNTRPTGSRLWQLERAKKVGQTPILVQARDYCREALGWLVEDGIAASVSVKTYWLTANNLGIEVAVTQPTGTVLEPFRFSWAWKS